MMSYTQSGAMIAWPDPPTLFKLAFAWLLISVPLAVLAGRWFRWLRGDFDRDE
jgi:hypothetical protein